VAGRYRRPTTPEQREKATRAREAKLAAAHQTLTEQVTALATGPQWRAWLDVAARFHHYSFNNTVLLLAQKADATQVAGYTLWQQLGRQVGKGEKGLVVLAPVIRRFDDETTDDRRHAGDGGSGSLVPGPVGGDPADAGRRRVVGFRPAYVWDVSQTTGDPLPEPPMPQLLAGQAPDGLWDALAAQCTAAGFTVDRRPIAGDAGPNGYTTYATRQVVVRADVDDAQAVKTLAHELGHVLMHDPTSFPAGETAGCRGAREVEAESVAYLVAAEHGLDTSGYTFAYLAAWATETGDVDATLRTTGTRVLATAHQILDVTRPEPADEAVERVAVDGDILAARTTFGAARTDALRDTATAPVSEPDVPRRERLVAANAGAAEFFFAQYPTSWAPGYLEQRIGTAMLDDRSGRVGYAPPGWTRLTDELRRQGFTDEEVLTSGVGVRASSGRIVDRFRDRLMFPIRERTDDGVEVVGFVGRRSPADDNAADARNPKYLNTPQTSLYSKGEHLLGLAENTDLLRRGGLAVLVEGPLDALAVDHAAQDTMAGLAPLGTAFTDTQAAQIRAHLGAESDRIVVAADNDPAGQKAARSAYQLLTAHRLDPRWATLPPGLDPAQTAELHGPAALVDLLATAQPMARQLVDHSLAEEDLTWVERQVAAARLASSIIAKAPPDTWEREINAVATSTGIDQGLLRSTLVETVATDTDAMGRPIGPTVPDDTADDRQPMHWPRRSPRSAHAEQPQKNRRRDVEAMSRRNR
jgi:DNA primase catalytic core